jgi:murein L,D-transpeptidase YcbB/YkuD
MSEAPAVLTSAVAAVHVDEEDVGVLSLLEDHHHHHHHHPAHASDSISAASLSLTAHTPISAADIDAMVVPHDPISHQARAVAALQQAADTASHMSVNPMGSRREQQQLEQGKQQFDSAQQASMSVQAPTSLCPSKDESEIPAATIPLTDSITVTAMTSDFGMPTASPHSICLCQAPTRIPRPRNG